MLFFRILKDGARHCTRYLGLDPPLDLNVHTGTAGTGSDILNTNHMFPNPVSPFTYPPTSLRLKFQNFFYSCARDVWFSERPIHRCFFTRLCMDVGSRQQYRKS